MKFGYARVSTPKQSLESQHTLLKKEGCERIFSDVMSGSKDARPEFDKLLAQLRPGDSITVTGIDRLGRSTRALSTLLESLHKQQVDLIILGHQIDTRTASGRLVFNVMAMLAENERLRLLERIHQGFEAARSQGRPIGRPSKLKDEDIQRLKEFYHNKFLRVSEICKMYKISRASFYRYLSLEKEKELEKDAFLKPLDEQTTEKNILKEEDV